MRRQFPDRCLLGCLDILGGLPVGEVAPSSLNLGPGNEFERGASVIGIRSQTADDALVDVDGANLAYLLWSKPSASVLEFGEVNVARRAPVLALAEEDPWYFAVVKVGLMMFAIDDGIQLLEADNVKVGARLLGQARGCEEGEGGSEGGQGELHGCRLDLVESEGGMKERRNKRLMMKMSLLMLLSLAAASRGFLWLKVVKTK